MKKIYSLVLVGIVISSCATLPNSTAITKDKNEAAIIYGQGDGGVAGFLKGILPTLGTIRDIELSWINGEVAIPVDEGKREYWLKEGNYKLYIHAQVKIDARREYCSGEISVTLEKGKEYIIDTTYKYEKNIFGFQEGTCIPRLREKT